MSRKLALLWRVSSQGKTFVWLLNSPLQTISWHVETFKKRIRFIGPASFSFLYLHLHLYTRLCIVQVSSVVYEIRCMTTSRIQFSLVFVLINWGITICSRSSKACKSADMSTYQSTQLSGVRLNFFKEQKQPVAENAQGQKRQGYRWWSSCKPQSVVEIQSSFL